MGVAMFIGDVIQRLEDCKSWMEQRGKPIDAFNKVIPILKQIMSDEVMEDETNKVQKSESVSKAVDGLKSFIKAEVDGIKSAVDSQLSEVKKRLDVVERAPRRELPQTTYTFKKGDEAEQISDTDLATKIAELTAKADKLNLEARNTGSVRLAEISKEMEETYKELYRLKYAVSTATNH
jgi:hypothetical protein